MTLLTWRKKQALFPNRCVSSYLEYRTINTAINPLIVNSNMITPNLTWWFSLRKSLCPPTLNMLMRFESEAKLMPHNHSRQQKVTEVRHINMLIRSQLLVWECLRSSCAWNPYITTCEARITKAHHVKWNITYVLHTRNAYDDMTPLRSLLPHF
jgi:hypothetical protein